MSTAKLMKITITYEYENEETKARLFFDLFFHDLSIRLWERLHINSKNLDLKIYISIRYFFQIPTYQLDFLKDSKAN
jgi:hypothetical protein